MSNKKFVYLLTVILIVIIFIMYFSNQNSKKIVKEKQNNVKKLPKKELNVWIMPNSENPEKDFLEISKPFIKENNIDINVTVIGWGAVWDKYVSAFTGVIEPPDIIQMGTTLVGSIASMDVLYNLKELYDDDDLVRATLETTRLRDSNEIVAMPWFIDTRVIYYRKSICENAGIDPAEDFKTWKSFELALKKIKESNQDILPFVMPGKNDWNVLHNFAPWVWSGGGKFISDDLKTTEINSEESRKGIIFYTELLQKGLLSKLAIQKNSAEVEQMFRRGEGAITINGPWLLKLREDTVFEYSDVGISVLPAGDGGRYSFFGGSNLGILKASENKEIASKFLEYLLSTKAQISYYEKTYNLPVTIEAVEELRKTADENKTIILDSLVYGRQYPCIPAWGISEKIFTEAFWKVWDNVSEVSGKYSRDKTKKILDEIVPDIERALAEN